MAPYPSCPLRPISAAARQELSPGHCMFGSPAACAICSVELFRQREVLGALTHQGQRVESNLYHASCITLMLAHNGAMLKHRVEATEESEKTHAPGVQRGLEISWGLSPVSRLPVDGFIRMPSLSDQMGFVEFVDWKRRGHITASDLAAVVGALLPIDEKELDNFIKSTFRVGDEGTLSQQELATRVLPYLEAHCPNIVLGARTSLQNATYFMRAVEGLKLLQDVCHLLALRSACRRYSAVADCIFAFELHRLLQASAIVKHNSLQRNRRCRAIAVALVNFTPGSHVLVVNSVSALFEQSDDDLAQLAGECLPLIGSKNDLHVFAALSSRLHCKHVSSRLALVKCLIVCSDPGSGLRSLPTLISLVSDAESRISTVAIQAIGSLAPRGNASAISAIALCLLHSNTAVKICAESVLPIIAKGDSEWINRFCSELRDETVEVRVKAIRTLGNIAEQGDQMVIRELHTFLQDNVKGGDETDKHDRTWVKASAILALGKVANKGDRSIMRPIAIAIHDEQCRIAEAAIRSFARLTEKGNKWAIKVLASVFDEDLWMQCPFHRALKILVLELFADIGKGGDATIFKEAAAHFKDSDLEIRTQAVRTAGKVWRVGDHRGIRAISIVAKGDADAYVRRVAEQALESLGVDLQVDEIVKSRPACICNLL